MFFFALISVLLLIPVILSTFFSISVGHFLPSLLNITYDTDEHPYSPDVAIGVNTLNM